MAYKGMGGMVKAPKKIKTPSGSDERLIYANDDEIEMLRQAGGSGNMTPYGGIRSYDKEVDESQSGEDEDSSDQKNYSDTTTEDLSSFSDDNDDDDDDNNTPTTTTPTESGPKEEEKTVWDKIREWAKENIGRGDMRKATQFTDKDGKIVNDFATLKDGTIVTRVYDPTTGLTSLISSDGRDLSGIDSNKLLKDQLEALENTQAGSGDTSGWGEKGSGVGSSVRQMTAEEAIIAGGEMFAKQLGFSQEQLDQAQADRASSVERMGGRRDYYGGTYDPETGEFTGGLEQKFYGEADRFDADYARQAQKAEELVAEGATLATDRGFYEGLQADTQASQKALRDYRGRLDTMRDEVGREPTARRDSLYASRVEDIDNQISGQQQQLSQMLAERGISPTSPVALRMMNTLKSNASNLKREARRSSLMDAMSMQQSEMSQRSALIGQASGLTQQEMQAIGMRGNIRNQRMGALAGSAQQYAGLAGMSGARSDQMMTRGTFFGGRASDLNNTLLAEAMDRQYGEENKRTTGMQMALSKYGADKQAEIAQAMARANQSGNRRSLLGTIAGGAAGYLLSSGSNPYAVMAGANIGGSLPLP